jgi:hypothetical protein
MLRGWQRYKNSPELRVRERFARENAELCTVYRAAFWPAERYFRRVNEDVSRQIHELRPQNREGIWHDVARGIWRDGSRAVVEHAPRRPTPGWGASPMNRPRFWSVATGLQPRPERPLCPQRIFPNVSAIPVLCDTGHIAFVFFRYTVFRILGSRI